MKFRMMDGQEYAGRSYRAVVAAMAGDKFRHPLSLKNYRTGVATRVMDALDIRIDAESDPKFIRSMEAAGLMKKVA